MNLTPASKQVPLRDRVTGLLEAGAGAVRTRKGTDLGQLPVGTFVERVKAEISGRRDLPDA